MKELHIHEVLRMMVEENKTYANKTDFVKDITEKFGSDIHFHACSGGNMNAEMAFDFLMQRGKISLNSEQSVAVDPEMTMCDDDKPHHHNH